MKTLVVGASGATGRLAVAELLKFGRGVKAVVRSEAGLPMEWKDNEELSIIKASILDMSVLDMQKHLDDCDSVVSCLGHTINLKGIYGKPRRLVYEAVKRLSLALTNVAKDKPMKFVLMNTTGNRNKDLNESYSIAEKVMMGIIRALLPPQADNEAAAEYLRTGIGKNLKLEWVAVRPDGLINEDQVSAYQVYPSPIRSAIFNAGKTSRINVGHFMASLICDEVQWEKWKGQMPVIYNVE